MCALEQTDGLPSTARCLDRIAPFLPLSLFSTSFIWVKSFLMKKTAVVKICWQHVNLPSFWSAQKYKTNIFTSTCTTIYPSRLFWCKFWVLEIQVVERSLLSRIQWNKTPLATKNSTAMSPSRNHDPVIQDKPQSFLCTVSWRIYFPTTQLHPPNVSLQRGKLLVLIVESIVFNWVMISGKRYCCWDFQMYVLWHFDHRKSSVVLFDYVWEKADYSHQNNLRG